MVPVFVCVGDFDVKGNYAAVADLAAESAPAAMPFVSESKRRWLASRLSRMVHSQPSAHSDVESQLPPDGMSSAASPAHDIEGGQSAGRKSVELPALRQAGDDGLLAAHAAVQTSLQGAAVQGATRSERIDALTERPAHGAASSAEAQPVALISAVQTQDGRLLVDSIAAGGAAQSLGAHVPSGAAAAVSDAKGSMATAEQQQVRRHADSGLGSFKSGSGTCESDAPRLPIEMAPVPRRGILQRLHLRSQPTAAINDVLLTDVP